MAKRTYEQVHAQAAVRFWERVNKTDSCWLWTGPPKDNGYGTLSVTYCKVREEFRAHRFSWALVNGPIPDGIDIDHKCHTPLCVRPDHLRPTTRKQNAENRQGANSQSRSGVRGVYWDTSKDRWRARVGHNGKGINVGLFRNLEDAEAAVIAKRRELHTHNNLDRTG